MAIVAHSDSTGQFAMVADGTSPASPVLADGVAVYTPGLSERRNGSSLFRHDDLLGSLRFLTDSNEGVQCYRLFSGFGATVASSGAAWEPFGWVGEAGDQTDADTGLVLMGHRLYDSRLGRFLSQDPAADGDNWYAYCDNDPVNGADPSGLSEMWGDFGYQEIDQRNSGSSLFGGNYERYREGTDFKIGFNTGAIIQGTFWGPWSDWKFTGGGMFIGGGLTLPNDPSGLPEGWKPDPSHKSPHDTRHEGPNGEKLDHHLPEVGQSKWRDKNHWHKLRLNDKGRWETDKRVGRDGGHLEPGDTVEWAAIGAGVGYGLWEVGKWGAAAFFAPETGGLSFAGAAALP